MGAGGQRANGSLSTQAPRPHRSGAHRSRARATAFVAAGTGFCRRDPPGFRMSGAAQVCQESLEDEVYRFAKRNR